MRQTCTTPVKCRVQSLTGEEYLVGADREGFMEEGALGVRSSPWEHNAFDNPSGDGSTDPHRSPVTGDAPSAALPVPLLPTRAGTLKKCLIEAHQHSPLVTLHPVECHGAELGLLAPVTPEEAEGLALAACELADVPSVPVEFAWAGRGKSRRHRGWHCGDIPFPLFEYSARIVLNRANGGDNLRTLAHELAHHVVGVRRIRESSTLPARRYRSHGRPFPETYYEMVGYVYAHVAAGWDLLR